MESARKFKIIVNSKECGTCSGPTPSAVAKKVVKKLCGKSNKVVKFSLKECKRGCERVCGPYQGRMEKLDKPCKRDGKTITHRVVCGKVRKMRGGLGLNARDFKKRERDPDVKIDEIGLRPHIFFGDERKNDGRDNVVNDYRFVMFNIEHYGKKTVGFKDNKLRDVSFDFLLKNYRELIEYLQSEILSQSSDDNKYKTIKRYLEPHRYKLTDTITDRNFYILLMRGSLKNMKNTIKSQTLQNSINEGIKQYLPKPELFEKQTDDSVITCNIKRTRNQSEMHAYYFIKNGFIFFSNNKNDEYYNFLLFFNDEYYIAIHDVEKNAIVCYPLTDETYYTSKKMYPENFDDLLISIFILCTSMNNNIYDREIIFHGKTSFISRKCEEIINKKNRNIQGERRERRKIELNDNYDQYMRNRPSNIVNQ